MKGIATSMSDAHAMIVTGASSGIGRALALAAARDGFAVLLVARRAERLETTAREIRAAGGAAKALAIDICGRDAADRIAAAAMQAFGRIDVLVNNAGAGAHGDLLAQSDADVEAQWQQHVAAPLRLSRAALPHLERTRGALVFVGSGVARVPVPAFGAYAPMKAAIRAAAIQLRRELRSHGIAVTYVDPGVVATEFHGTASIARPRSMPAVPAERVAAAMLRGIKRRSATVNAVAWQTAGTIAGEMLGTLVDPVIERMRMQRTAREPHVPDEPPVSHDPHERREPAPQPGPEPRPTPTPPAPAESTVTSPFEAALAPVARRMERVKLPERFLREALVPGGTLEANELAMRWAGMPNKNERAALREALDALALAGYLEPTGEETWRVVRAAE
jgi:short-subunit dehydrogenase